MKESNFSNKSYWPILVIVLSVVMLILSYSIDNFSVKTKLGFVGKIGLIVGMISLWLFTILRKRDQQK